MLDEIRDIGKILFLDIETVPAQAQYSDLDETWQTLWKHKAKSILKKSGDDPVTDDEAASVYDRAGIYAEFGKIICISVGIFATDKETGKPITRLKSFAHDDEVELLRGFCEMLNKSYNTMDKFLCGHNIKEFDIPFICRRIVSHLMPLPTLLDISGKKPWETKHLIDTMELWKFGDNKAYTSVKLLAAVFGFPSPKDDIDGSEVADVYYNEKDLERIARYCEKDVVAVMQLILKFKRMPLKLSIDGKVVSNDES